MFTHFFLIRVLPNEVILMTLVPPRLQRESCPISLASLSVSLFPYCAFSKSSFRTGFKEKENTVVIVALSSWKRDWGPGAHAPCGREAGTVPPPCGEENLASQFKGGGGGSVAHPGEDANSKSSISHGL